MKRTKNIVPKVEIKVGTDTKIKNINQGKENMIEEVGVKIGIIFNYFYLSYNYSHIIYHIRKESKKSRRSKSRDR